MLYIVILGACGIIATGIDAHNIIRKSYLELSYHGTMHTTCDFEDYRFQAITNSKLSDCVIECALCEYCAVMNYRPDYKLCELHQNNAVMSSNISNCFRVEREDIDITQSPCMEMPCSNGTSCDTNSGICKIKECLEVPRLNNGRVCGNLRAIGNRIKYECDEGYHLLDSLHEVAECLDNGTWSTRGECVTDYIASAVGELCNTTNCLDPSVRCVNKTDSEQYCHCNFGFEYDEIERMCVEVCNEYSTKPSDFQGLSGYGIAGYNFKPSIIVTSFAECVSHCVNTYPLFLSIEYFTDFSCLCGRISEEQQVFVHTALNAHGSITFFNRPCAITI